MPSSPTAQNAEAIATQKRNVTKTPLRIQLLLFSIPIHLTLSIPYPNDLSQQFPTLITQIEAAIFLLRFPVTITTRRHFNLAKFETLAKKLRELIDTGSEGKPLRRAYLRASYRAEDWLTVYTELVEAQATQIRELEDALRVVNEVVDDEEDEDDGDTEDEPEDLCSRMTTAARGDEAGKTQSLPMPPADGDWREVEEAVEDQVLDAAEALKRTRLVDDVAVAEHRQQENDVGEEGDGGRRRSD